MTIDIDSALAFAIGLAEEASEAIRTTRPQRILTKTSPADLCTEMDSSIEQTVRTRIRSAYPEHSVDGEELGLDRGSGSEYTWYVDPIDGTTNYVSGIPWGSYSLALADAGGALLGVVANPFLQEVATAVRGRGAWLDGTPVRATGATAVAGQAVLTEWSGHRPWPGMIETLAAISQAYGTTRIMGSSALALTSVAVGRAAGTIIGSFHAVDDLAGVLLARESGAGVIERDDGVLVAGPGVVEELARLWRRPVDDASREHMR